MTSSKDKDKYTFFCKATQLEQIENDIRDIRDKLQAMENALGANSESEGRLKAELHEAEQLYRECEKFREAEQKIKELRYEVIWAYINEKKEERDQCQQQLTHAEKVLEKGDAEIAKWQDAEAQIGSSVTNILSDLESKRSEVADIVRERDAINDAMRTKKRDLTASVNKVKSLQAKIAGCEEEMLSLRRQIEDTQSSARSRYEAERRKKAEAIEKKESDLAEAQQRLRDKRTVMQGMEDALRASEESAFSRVRSLKGIENELRSLDGNLKMARASTKDRVRIFGHQMPEILQAIAREKWSKTPIGPIGMHIQLKDEKWVLPVEEHLKNNLNNFLVNSADDAMKLRRIFEKICRNKQDEPTIIYVPFTDQVYARALREKLPATSMYCALMDVLQIDVPHIVNVLIDHRKIHRVLLFEKYEDAREVMLKKPPQGCNQAYDIRGDNYKPGGQVYSMAKQQRRSGRLTANVEDHISQLERDMKERKTELEQLRQHDTKAKAETAAKKNEIQAFRKKLMADNNAVVELESVLHELRNTEIEEPPVLSDLESMLNGVEREVEVLREQLHEAQSQQQMLKAAIEPEKKKLADVGPRAQKLEECIQELSAQLDKAQRNQKTCRDKLAKAHADLARAQADRDQAQREYKTLSDDVHTLEDAAKKNNVPEKDTREKPAALKKKIASLEKQLQRHPDFAGRFDAVARDLAAKKNKVLEIVRQQKNIRLFVDALQDAVKIRGVHFAKYVHLLEMRIRYLFKHNLAQKKFLGDMHFNHGQRTLTIRIRTDKENSEFAEATSLSGGEKSYLTVCFIMSLWEAAESPFRALDEFDVFMDQVNRKVSMDMMIECASQQASHQFILLTPLNLVRHKRTGNLKVFELNPPEKGQATMDQYASTRCC
eukprot:m.299558 g.299558  ORF g.299558 m.299558 type:complete len:889 (-) comp22985_c3_seq48:1706-4372(-)